MSEPTSFYFHETGYGVTNRKLNLIRRWALSNGHMEKTESTAVNKYMSDYDLIGNQSKIFDYKNISNTWKDLGSNKELNINELINLVKQCLSSCESSSRLGINLLYSLDSHKYLDVQKLINRCLDYKLLLHSNNYEVFDIVNKSVSMRYDSPSLNCLTQINKEPIANKDIFYPVCSWLFEEYPIALSPKTTKVRINIYD